MGRSHNGSLSTLKPVIQELGNLLTKAFKSGNRNTILSRASTILDMDFPSPTSLSKTIKGLHPEEDVKKIRQLRSALSTFAFTNGTQQSTSSKCPTSEEMNQQGVEPDISALLQQLRLEQIPDEELPIDDDESLEYGAAFNENDFQY